MQTIHTGIDEGRTLTVRPLLLERMKHTIQLLTWRLCRRIEDLPRMTLDLRILAEVLNHATVGSKEDGMARPHLSLLYQATVDQVTALVRLCDMLDLYIKSDSIKFDRVFLDPRILEEDNVYILQSKLSQSITDGVWKRNLIPQLVLFALPSAMPAESQGDACAIIARLLQVVQDLPYSLDATQRTLTGRRKKKEGEGGEVPLEPQGSHRPIVRPTAVACYALYVRLLEHALFAIEHPVQFVPGSTTARGTLPERQMEVRNVASLYGTALLSSIRDVGATLKRWVDDPWAQPSWLPSEAVKLTQAASALAESAAAIPGCPAWPEATSPEYLESYVCTPWALSIPQGTKDVTTAILQAADPLVADLTHKVAPAEETVASWIEALWEAASEAVRIGEVIRPLGPIASSGGFVLAPPGTVHGALEVCATSQGYPILGSEIATRFVLDHPLFYAHKGVDITRLDTLAHLRAVLAEASAPLALLIQSAELEPLESGLRAIVPTLDYARGLTLSETRMNLDGLLDMWGLTAENWSQVLGAMDLSSHETSSIRMLAHALRFVGVVEVLYGHKKRGEALAYALPWDGGWYHSGGPVPPLAYLAPEGASIPLASGLTREVEVMPGELKTTTVNVTLRPFSHIPGSALLTRASSNLTRLAAERRRPGRPIIQWMEQTATSGLEVGAASGAAVTPRIIGWNIAAAPVRDIVLIDARRADQNSNPATMLFQLIGTAKLLKWARPSNALVSYAAGTAVKQWPPEALIVDTLMTTPLI